MDVVNNIIGKRKRSELPRFVDRFKTKKVEQPQSTRPREYYCNLCEIHHRDNSSIGREHLQYAGPHRGKTAYQQTIRRLKKDSPEGYHYAMQHEEDKKRYGY